MQPGITVIRCAVKQPAALHFTPHFSTICSLFLLSAKNKQQRSPDINFWKWNICTVIFYDFTIKAFCFFCETAAAVFEIKSLFWDSHINPSLNKIPATSDVMAHMRRRYWININYWCDTVLRKHKNDLIIRVKHLKVTFLYFTKTQSSIGIDGWRGLYSVLEVLFLKVLIHLIGTDTYFYYQCNLFRLHYAYSVSS